MFAKVNSVAHVGIESYGVTVEVDISNRGFPSFDIVGLASKSVAESKQRIKTALINSGISFPAKKIVVNLAPADIPKEGTFYDLPIAVGIICALNNFEVPAKSLFYGELSLNGDLRKTSGTFLAGVFAKNRGFGKIFIPTGSYSEVSGVKALGIVKIDTMSTMFNYLNGSLRIKESFGDGFKLASSVGDLVDFSDIIGQERAKRALIVAAAGGHNVMLIGPPGVGKSMLGKALRGVLPELNESESLETAKIYSTAGFSEFSLERPFRSPHHTCTFAGFVGGNGVGELSLAHNGVLFMDEFPEFPLNLIQSLRQPLEEGYCFVSRDRQKVKIPSDFMLLGTANPCPCGFNNVLGKKCVCNFGQIQRYKSRLSGPIMDRIDIVVPVDYVESSVLTRQSRKIGSEFDLRAEISRARDFQYKTQSKLNSKLISKEVGNRCTLSKESMTLLNSAISKLGLSGRGYFKVLKVARTIADLQNSQCIESEHLLEALSYRQTT